MGSGSTSQALRSAGLGCCVFGMAGDILWVFGSNGPAVGSRCLLAHSCCLEQIQMHSRVSKDLHKVINVRLPT